MLGYIIRFITFPFRYFFGSVKYTYKNGFEYVRDSRLTVRNRIMNLIPVLMITTILITFVYAMVSFVVSGGYQSQIAQIKELGICDECFTAGTVPYMFNVVTIIIIGALLLAGIILGSIEFYKNDNVHTSGRVLYSIVLTLFAIAGIVLIGDFFHYIINNGTKDFLDELLNQNIAEDGCVSDHIADIILMIMGKDVYINEAIVNDIAKVVAIVMMIVLYFLMKGIELEYEAYITKRCILTYCFIIPVVIAAFQNVIAIVVFLLSLLLTCLVFIFCVGGVGGCLENLGNSIEADGLRKQAKSLDKQAGQAFFKSTRDEKHREAAELRHQAYVIEHRSI